MPKQLQRSRTAARPSASTVNRYLLLAVIVLLAGAVLWFKNQAKPAPAALDEPAEVQFDRYLQQKTPMLAFFHINRLSLLCGDDESGGGGVPAVR